MSVDAGVINVSGSEVYVVNNKATGRPHREKKGNTDWLKPKRAPPFVVALRRERLEPAKGLALSTATPEQPTHFCSWISPETAETGTAL